MRFNGRSAAPPVAAAGPVYAGEEAGRTESPPPDSGAFRHWRAVQDAMLLAAVVLVWLLLFRPAIGVTIMWNVIVPTFPALFVLATGLWRNLCPMGTFSLLPRRLGFSRRRVMSPGLAGLSGLASVAALSVILPLRHLSLDSNGTMTALMLMSASGIAVAMGVVFQWRSGWCTSLCPIHPVEKLYGFSPLTTVENMRCGSCGKCSTPCPDSTRSMTSVNTVPSRLGGLVGHGLTGGFVGFVFGWYQLPDFEGRVGAAEILACYVWPFGAAAATLVVYAAARKWLCRSKTAQMTLVRVFAAAAVSAYYWYRLPALAGFGPNPGTGMLYDLTGVLPVWVPAITQALTTSFFAWFMLVRRRTNASWMVRPAYET
ncbi:MAG: ferredoxin [Nitrospinae bacterium]|nr:ferredoxin [Nitrospinota bacterium]